MVGGPDEAPDTTALSGPASIARATVRTVKGITRATIETEPRWRNALTRNRARSGTV